jgi:hypothetical protein
MPDASTIDPAAILQRELEEIERNLYRPASEYPRQDLIDDAVWLCQFLRIALANPETPYSIEGLLEDRNHYRQAYFEALADTRRVDDLEALVRDSSRSVGIRLYDPKSDHIAIGFTFNRSFRYHDAKAPTLREAIDDGIKLFRAADPFEVDSDAAMAATPKEESHEN